MKILHRTINNGEEYLFDSSNVLRMRWYSDSTLEITYGKGSIYVYQGVPRYVAMEIANAPSQGKVVSRIMRKEGKGVSLYRESRAGSLSPAELAQLKSEIAALG